MYKTESLIVNEKEVFRLNDVVKVTIKEGCRSNYFKDKNKTIVGRLERANGNDSMTLDVSQEFLRRELTVALLHVEKIELLEADAEEQDELK